MLKMDIEKCVKNLNINYFELVLISSKRTRNLITGKEVSFIKNSEYLNKMTQSLKEISMGYIKKDYLK